MSGTNKPGNIPPQEEQEPNRDVNALFSNFRLDQSTYRTFNRHRIPKAPEQPEVVPAEPQHRNRIHIGVFSPMGGSGRSMLTASLGNILWRMGKRVLLVDTSPWQSLAFHYGATGTRSGMRSFFASETDELPVRILAGEENDASRLEWGRYMATTPVDYVLYDLSGVSGKELPPFLQECDILLTPLLPDPSAVRLAESVTILLGKLSPAPERVRFVINQMEDSSAAKEVRDKLSHLLGEQLLPNPIYRQPEVAEALAEGVVLPMYAPKAQAVAVCNEIARTLEVKKTATAGRAQQRWCER